MIAAAAALAACVDTAEASTSWTIAGSANQYVGTTKAETFGTTEATITLSFEWNGTMTLSTGFSYQLCTPIVPGNTTGDHYCFWLRADEENFTSISQKAY